jgi:uncharacterized protein
MNAQALIEKLQLKPHPEGGWFREIHRAAETVNTPRGARSALTTIYYLLERDQLSRWHVVQSDEIWHFYAGAPLELVVYDPAKRVCRPTVLDTPTAGRELAGTVRDLATAECGAVGTVPDTPTAEREPVGIVRAGEWQAARSLGDYSLVGCNVGPGFDFADFQFVAALPGHADHFAVDLSRYRTLL